jgi:putative phosphoesterase
MRIGILSDTHNQRRRTEAAVNLLRAEGADVLIHCGDLVDADLIDLLAVMPFYLVFGNNDMREIPDIKAAIQEIEAATCLDFGGIIELAGKRIGVTHGHLLAMYRQLLAAKPDYLFLGHSHVSCDEFEGSTRLINPGALHRAESYSVAMLNLEDDDLRFLAVTP